MILEGLVTTINEDETVNVSPMGPLVEAEVFESFLLRPYQTSTTFQNLKRNRCGVFHVTDDVEMIAKSAIGKLQPAPPMRKAPQRFQGYVLQGACRWYAFRVQDLNDSEERTNISCEIVDRGQQREFFGFCRAKHAIIEAAILATRIGILPESEIQEGFQRLSTLVEKTGGDPERRAFDMLHNYLMNKVNN